MNAARLLYQQALGAHAQVTVTHTLPTGSELAPYAGNLALHVNDQAIAVQARRAALEAELGLPVQWLNQVHGTYVAYFPQHDPLPPTADASVTQSKQLALGILTADCLPVVFATQDGSVVAGAHAGWRGLLNGVLSQTWAALRVRSPSSPIIAHLGPCIGQAQFEVGSEVQAAFVAQNAAWAGYFAARQDGKYLADLCGLARHQLLALGAPAVTGGGWCTVSDARLASYRRSARLNQASGRFATLVRLLP